MGGSTMSHTTTPLARRTRRGACALVVMLLLGCTHGRRRRRRCSQQRRRHEGRAERSAVRQGARTDQVRVLGVGAVREAVAEECEQRWGHVPGRHQGLDQGRHPQAVGSGHERGPEPDQGPRHRPARDRRGRGARHAADLREDLSAVGPQARRPGRRVVGHRRDRQPRRRGEDRGDEAVRGHRPHR